MSTYNELPLIRELRRRFPLIHSIRGMFGSESEERIPWFIGLILAATLTDMPGPCCFVLDKTRGTAAIAAILLALSKLKEEFPELSSIYARTAFSKGDRVRVKPSNFVYEYEGVWEDRPNKFRLKVQGRQDWRSFEISDVLRLEPTTRLRPRGTLSSNLGIYEQDSLDRLLNVTTYGNHSLIRNNVLMYLSSAQFARIANVVSLSLARGAISDPLSDYLPWGTLGPDGEMRVNDFHQVMGEPLVAVTNSVYDLVAAARRIPAASKPIIVDGARPIVRDLQVLDNLSDSQRVLILASPEEEDALRVLRERECPIWYLSPDEILIGEDAPKVRSRSSLIGHTVKAALTRDNCRVNPVQCDNKRLEDVASRLEGVAGLIDGDEVRAEVDSILAQLYGILLEMSECFFGVTHETRAKLQTVMDELERNARWLARNVAVELLRTVDELDTISLSGWSTEAKPNALTDVLAETRGRRLIAARSSRSVEYFRNELDRIGINVPVLPIQALSIEDEYDCIIVPSWPGRRRFARLKNIAVTQDIRVLVHSFELRWLRGYENSERFYRQYNHIDAETRADIVGIDPDMLPTTEPAEPAPRRRIAVDEPPLFRLENRIARRPLALPMQAVSGADARKARLVEFNGGCYALLTEWAQLNALTELVYGLRGEDSRIRLATVDDLSIDDFLLFRAGGDKEFIRLLAEDILGTEEYESNRELSDRWKSPFLRFGNNVDRIQERLESFGLHRNYQTIAHWVRDPYLIGPGDLTDIGVIAEAFRDSFLSTNSTSIKEAISRIRGAHISAGSRLTRLILDEVHSHLGQLDGQPVLIDFGYGQAWVVQVRTIDAVVREYPYDDVNRLLWFSDFSF